MPGSSFASSDPSITNPYTFNWPSLALGTTVLLHPQNLNLEALDTSTLYPLDVPAQNYFIYTLFPRVKQILEQLPFSNFDDVAPTGKRVVYVYGSKLKPKPGMKFWKGKKEVNAVILDLHEPEGTPKHEGKGLKEAKKRIEASGILKGALGDGEWVVFKVFCRRPGGERVAYCLWGEDGEAVAFGRLGQ